ncbi:MAG TPA: hypothetical protein VHQ22_22920 [Terriglobales bacterium]|nr:hypothetical protein [Terriglobales bacterium]
MRSTFGALAVFMFAGILQVLPAGAQFQNPIRAAKDAYNKAKQQSQQQKQQGQAQNQQSAPTQTASAAQPAASQTSSADLGDCCSADAQAKAAAAASFLDIVGIKLGMTPQQVTAAVNAYDSSLKIEVLTARLYHPTKVNFDPVPHYMFVHSVNQRQQTGQVERIVVEFTTPPGHPVVEEVQRYIIFPLGQPVLSSNLLGSLRKKYGQENSGSPDQPVWVYDSNGKLLSQVSGTQASCGPGGNLTDVGNQFLGDPTTHDARETISLASTGSVLQNSLTPACLQYGYVQAWPLGPTPNTQVIQMNVAIRSGALVYGSVKGTHDWLQAEADAKAKQDQNAASQRSGPKL